MSKKQVTLLASLKLHETNQTSSTFAVNKPDSSWVLCHTELEHTMSSVDSPTSGINVFKIFNHTDGVTSSSNDEDSKDSPAIKCLTESILGNALQPRIARDAIARVRHLHSIAAAAAIQKQQGTQCNFELLQSSFDTSLHDTPDQFEDALAGAFVVAAAASLARGQHRIGGRASTAAVIVTAISSVVAVLAVASTIPSSDCDANLVHRRLQQTAGRRVEGGKLLHSAY